MATRFVEGLTAQRLANTDLQLSSEAATTIAKAVTDVDSGAGGLVARSTKVVEIAKRVDGLAEQPAQVQRRIVTALLRRSDGLRLADELDAVALRAALDVGRLDEAAELVSRTDAGGRLLSAMSKSGVRSFLRFSVGRAGDVRVTITKSFDDGWMSVTDVALFGSDVVDLARANAPGLVRVLNEDIATHADKARITRNTFNPIQGAVHELRVAIAEVGSRSVEHLGQKIGRSSDADIVFDWSTALERLGTSELLRIVQDVEIPTQELNRLGVDTRIEYVRTILRRTTELEMDVREVGDTLVYVEAKSGQIDADDLISKYIRMRTFARIRGKESVFVVTTRLDPEDAANGGTGDALQVIRGTEDATITKGGSELDFPTPD